MTASSYAETAATEHTAAGRASFEPPPPRGLGGALTLALLAHLLLLLALAWGLRWKKDAQDQAVEAELWSAIAQLAAPQAVQVQPPPITPPEPVPVPDPVPVPQPKPAPPVQDDSARQAEIALEQQKQREAEQRRRAEEEQKRQQAQREEEQQRQIAQAKAKAERAEAERKKAAAEQRERQQANLSRATALASADQSGMINPVNGPGQTPGGTQSRDAGPSASWGAKVRAKVYPNITYPNLSNIKGNPKTVVEVRTSPDGAIIDRRVVKSSGVRSWDEAVLRALDKTQTLPRDVDGRVPSPITIGFTPR